MSALSWLEAGPEEWERQYVAAHPLMSWMFAAAIFLPQRKCPQCGEAHNLSQCPRWRVQ